MVSLTMASPSNFSTSHTRLLLSSSLVSSLLFCLMLFCLLSKVTTDASLRVLFFAFLYMFFKKIIWAMGIGLICLLHFLNQFGAFGLHLKARNKQKILNFPLQHKIINIAVGLRFHTNLTLVEILVRFITFQGCKI